MESKSHSGIGKEKKKIEKEKEKNVWKRIIEKEKEENVWERKIFNLLQRRRRNWKKIFGKGKYISFLEEKKNGEEKGEKWRRVIDGDINRQPSR